MNIRRILKVFTLSMLGLGVGQLVLLVAYQSGMQLAHDLALDPVVGLIGGLAVCSAIITVYITYGDE